MATKRTQYIVQRGVYGQYGRVGIVDSLVMAKHLIAKDGQLLTKYAVIRITPKGTETRIGVYQNKSKGYRYGNRMVVVRV